MGLFDKTEAKKQDSKAAANQESESSSFSMQPPVFQLAGSKIRNKRKESANRNRLGRAAKLKSKLPFYRNYYKGLLAEHDEEANAGFIQNTSAELISDLNKNKEMFKTGEYQNDTISDEKKEDRRRVLSDRGVDAADIDEIISLPKAHYQKAAQELLLNVQGPKIKQKPLPQKPQDEELNSDPLWDKIKNKPLPQIPQDEDL